MTTASAKLIYDDRCSICTAWAGWVKARDQDGRFELVRCSEWEGGYDGCKEVRLVTADGLVLGGFRAVPEILSALPRFRWLGRILSWRIMQRPLGWGYSKLALNRRFLKSTLGKWQE